MKIEAVSTVLGAEVTGVQVNDLTEGEFDALRAAFVDHSVLFFRGQQLEPEDHLEFALRWGELDQNAYFGRVDGYPGIAEVLKEPDQQVNIGGGWHTDHSYDREPALGSLLRAIELPPSGGDTLFASMGAAYDSLSDGFKELLAPLRARHTNAHTFNEATLAAAGLLGRINNPDNEARTATHPVVVEHPGSGRPVLYVNPGFTVAIEGFSLAESKALLGFLFQHAAAAAHTIRLQWEPGTMAFWDNRATWHWALNDYDGHRRYLHRITVAGEPLVAAA